MAEALKLKVDINVFKDTLDQLGNVLQRLQGQRDSLKSEVDRMTGETFSGTNVQEAIDLAEESLRRVENAIVKVTAQRDAIQQYLSGMETQASTLESNVSSIREELPDLFD
ncbi:hypothetical protein [Frisingicoccus sp.]|uniref:hypothetical protein n=1 Tax=Frisingicoccus sp. TaxID=1918627 RepID=UPI003AB2F3E4